MVSSEGIEMADEKVEALEALNQYRVSRMSNASLGSPISTDGSSSKIAPPLTNSPALKPSEWRTNPEIEEAQRTLIQAFTPAPVLEHFAPDLPAIIETDASDFALGGILSQKHEGRLHPAAFHSRKFSPAEIDYDTHGKEPLTVVGMETTLGRSKLSLRTITSSSSKQQRRLTGGKHWQELAGCDFKIFVRTPKRIT